MKGKKGFMAVKLDMSKAYDRVEWHYLETIMRMMGFEEKWIRIIMKCVRSVSYSILLNGLPYGDIHPTRGLRQGDPLSPYLFLLVAERLSSFLARAELEGQITGVPIIAGGIRVSHLLFPDDSLLFYRATFPEWRNIGRLLHSYEVALGQKLNAAKTLIFFSPNTREDFKSFIRTSIGISSTQCYEKYLGLPSLVGRSKTQTFAGIQSRVCRKLDGWKEKFLSQAGHEILIKAVVQAIPAYSMSIFQLPKKLCSTLNSMTRRFWWGHKDDNKGVSWISWERLGQSKFHGGMGFRDLEIFNRPLMAKQGWRLLKHPDSLMARVLKAKYYPHGDFLIAKLGSRPSYAWRSIFNAKDVLEARLVWRVGNGENIKIWRDKWLTSSPHYLFSPPHQGLDLEARVSKLIDPSTGWWNFPLIRSIFLPNEADRICKVAISPLQNADIQIWNGTSTRVFSVKSAYHLEIQRWSRSKGECSARVDGVWKELWKLEVAPVVKNFWWRVCQNVLPTKDNLFSKKNTPDPLFPICLKELETLYHSLWQCPPFMAVWQEGSRRLQKLAIEEVDGAGLLQFLWTKLQGTELQEAFFVTRLLWMRRNNLVFRGEFSSPFQVASRARQEVEEFHHSFECIAG
jgi:hypothetical protein